MRTMALRGTLYVTFEVPHTFSIDFDDFEAWRGEPVYEGHDIDTDELLAFVKYQDDACEITAEFPNVNPALHEVYDSEISEVEIVGPISNRLTQDIQP